MDDQILIGVQRRLRALEANATHYRIAEDGTAQLVWRGGRTALNGAAPGSAGYFINVMDHGATGDGVADDTAEIQAALDAAETDGDTVVAPAGNYLISSRITVPTGVSLWGAGNNFDSGEGAATRFTCSGATSGITFEGHEGTSGNFTIDANNSADNPWKCEIGHGRTFISLDAIRAAEDNLWCADVQNAVFLSCTLSNAAQDNLLLDLGSTGNLFSRLETNNPGRHGILMTQSGAGAYGHAPGMNRFDTCHIEDQASASTGDPLHVEFSHYANEFTHCAFLTNSSTDRPSIQLTEADFRDIGLASLIFSNCNYIRNSATTGIPAVSISLDTDDHKITFVGAQHLVGYDYLLDDPGTNAGDAVRMSGVYISSDSAGTVGGNISPDTTPTGYTQVQERTDFVMGDDAQNATLRSLTSDKSGMYWLMTPVGLMAWGPGSDYVPDTFLARSAVGFLEIDSGFTFPAIAAASAPNNSLFRDAATGKLSYKDNSGVTNALY